MQQKSNLCSQVFFLFALFDEKNSGKLSCSNLTKVLTESMKENGVIFDDEMISRLVDVLIEESVGTKRKCKDTVFGYNEMKQMMGQEKAISAALAESLDSWLVPKEKLPDKRVSLPERMTKKYVENNLPDVMFFIFLVISTVIAFSVRAYQFRTVKGIDNKRCWYVIFARGTG